MPTAHHDNKRQKPPVDPTPVWWYLIAGFWITVAVITTTVWLLTPRL
jgi:hypothetical protein